MPEKVGHWKCSVNLAEPWVWGIDGDLKLHCKVVIILAGSCSKTKQAQTIMYSRSPLSSLTWHKKPLTFRQLSYKFRTCFT